MTSSNEAKQKIDRPMRPLLIMTAAVFAAGMIGGVIFGKLVPAHAAAPATQPASPAQPAAEAQSASATEPAEASESHFRTDFLPYVTKAVPGILKSQDPKTGRFGTGVWIVNDQHVMWPLAVAWGTEGTPYYHDPKVLEAVMKGGDALIDDMDETGQWVFRKKDNSTWGKIYMPWTYSRWIRSFAIIHDAMPPERRERWEKAIALGCEGMIKTQLTKEIQNIPATDASAVYIAGQVMNRPEWCKAAADYLHRTVDAQDPGGFWTEHVGPVINYNFVYVDAIGHYYAASHDPYVLPALERAARYHAHFTYPDGSPVETVDERNCYEHGRGIGGLGFTFSAEGRGFIQQQFELIKAAGADVSADQSASIVHYGQDGPITPTPRNRQHDRYVLGHNDAMTAKEGPWFACLSAYTAPLSMSRWIQDRQNFVSVFNSKTGLILGGGNTKLTPLWSTFTAGDTSLLFHKPGDEDPDFAEPKGLIHVPSKAVLDPEKLSVGLTYGDAQCRASVDLADPTKAVVTYALESTSSLPVEAHAIFLAKVGRNWRTASGKSGKIGKEKIELSSEEAGGWFETTGFRFSVPPGSRIVWPVILHDQYKKDGAADYYSGRLVTVLALGSARKSMAVRVEGR